ncbi:MULTISPECIES: DUF4241 domain-containing protein [Chryseobacterium]|uniref:DUF4241 domain-containing protein n=1 Tax=Chryseobacterium camelliae TaxID=1265445 RepID=A0ABU0TNZ4_9FLAO|nr:MULTISPECIES: DUF4241 domain-containing protein [Chryseobacterium]MDT3407395.1 hypothetical protein [Pseudacidovorax intermedius]MDQ1098756.1 hypothetical protein [Chryseobacterium camelliae]MDQ1102680.1 hypothetical protein [Chryseobacterium sp. SORGH_AS_1048]MDR6086108.1 hypothetical protein [Chryseobacterium sp. SORGH_AS_0909]MDR6130478.1 hypothetical protein [Chryseobacterium sp. SORGH_AS_1175]
MNTTWMQQWESIKHILVCPTDLESYFTSAGILGLPVEILEIGDVSLPSGKIVVRDPLVFLDSTQKPYFVNAPKGNFPVTIAVAKFEEWGNRYAAVRVKFTDGQPVRYQEALIGNENLEGVQQDDYFGFHVDAGLACITDSEALPAFDAFVNKLNMPNLYDDYFAGLFKESYEEHPEHQRQNGDWINWTIPGTDYQIPMFATGFGDGTYPVYFGYDKNNSICGLYIQFIDIELALSDEKEDNGDDEP